MVQRCILQHRGFAALGDISFRRSSSDGTAVLALDLGGRDAAVPLTALQRELGIAESSEDGRMLVLIAEALAYVPALRPGDALPAEVLTGDASWEPAAEHRARALDRMRGQLLTWLGQETGDTSLASAITAATRIDSEPGLRTALQDAFARAARALEAPDTAAVVRLLEEAADELSFIEALRSVLLTRVEAVAANVEALAGTGWRGDLARFDVLMQVQRLSTLAAQDIAMRFAEIDAQTGDVIATLRNIEGQRVFIRGQRDWLHRTRIAWDPVLAGWDARPRRLDEAAWTLLGRTYQFLARRYMPFQEWVDQSRRGATKPRSQPVLVW